MALVIIIVISTRPNKLIVLLILFSLIYNLEIILINLKDLIQLFE